MVKFFGRKLSIKVELYSLRNVVVVSGDTMEKKTLLLNNHLFVAGETLDKTRCLVY